MKNQEKCIADQYKEALDLGQQLRLEREQMQHIHLDLLETRRLLVQAQRETDRLSHELEEVNHLSQEKVSKPSFSRKSEQIINLYKAAWILQMVELPIEKYVGFLGVLHTLVYTKFSVVLILY